jgi:hypothetical protein
MGALARQEKITDIIKGCKRGKIDFKPFICNNTSDKIIEHHHKKCVERIVF